jgi:hypothetical protein
MLGILVRYWAFAVLVCDAGTGAEITYEACRAAFRLVPTFWSACILKRVSRLPNIELVDEH